MDPPILYRKAGPTEAHANARCVVGPGLPRRLDRMRVADIAEESTMTYLKREFAITMAKIKGIVYTALMAAWTRGGGLLAPRESAPACRKYHYPGHRWAAVRCGRVRGPGEVMVMTALYWCRTDLGYYVPTLQSELELASPVRLPVRAPLFPPFRARRFPI